MTLKVGIVGCGIAGLAAATALAKVGHDIEIFERSQFKNEVGAAIVIGPNGTRILSNWGFDFDNAGALDYCQMRRIKADTIELDSEERFTNIQEKYGSRWLLFHRADLHSGLRKLAEQAGSSLKIRLGSPVVHVDVENGVIDLAEGRSFTKDLIVIADGAHSELLAQVVGRSCPVSKSPMSMYRFLRPFSQIMNNDQANQFYKDVAPGFTTFYKTEVGRPGLLLNTYPCRGGELLYCALVHPTKPKEQGLEGWDSPADYQDLISDAQGFHQSVQAICENAVDIKVYTQMWREPLDRFVKGRAVLIGDSGHLMLPTHGQGASQAIEDAAALQVLFDPASNKSVEETLQIFDQLRGPRVRAVQTMSNKMMGPPEKMTATVRSYYKGAIPSAQAKTFSAEYNDFFFCYNVMEDAKNFIDKS